MSKVLTSRSENYSEWYNDLILKVAHSKPETLVFWYLNESYLGSTKDIHEFAMKPKRGKHIVTIVDEFGNESKRWIDIVTITSI